MSDGGKKTTSQDAVVDSPLSDGNGRNVTREEIGELDLSGRSDRVQELLLEQTRRTLDRHADVQKSQRQQAVRVLRGTVAVTGLTITALPFVTGFFESIQFAESVGLFRSLTSLLLVITMAAIGESIVGDIYNVIEAAIDVLTPEPTRRGAFGQILAISGFLRQDNTNEISGSGVRSVSMLDELIPDIRDEGDQLPAEVVQNRLERIHRNEQVINQNSQNLSEIYQRVRFALERVIVLLLLSLAVFIALGAQL